MRLLPPVRFRFHEDDREKYGDGWTVYDESALVRIPTRDLVEIERELAPMSIMQMLARYRTAHADGHLAATWVARRLAGDSTPFDEWDPLVLLVEWEQVPAGDVDPPAQTSSPSPDGE